MGGRLWGDKTPQKQSISLVKLSHQKQEGQVWFQSLKHHTRCDPHCACRAGARPRSSVGVLGEHPQPAVALGVHSDPTSHTITVLSMSSLAVLAIL